MSWGSTVRRIRVRIPVRSCEDTGDDTGRGDDGGEDRVKSVRIYDDEARTKHDEARAGDDEEATARGMDGGRRRD